MVLNNKNKLNNTIEELQRHCISLIVYVFCATLVLHSIIFYFTFTDKNFALCTFIYFIVLLYTFLLVKKTFKIKPLVHIYLILDPLFAAFVMLYFWKQSLGMALWVFPVSIGAYVFLETKYVYIYTFYILIITAIVAYVSSLMTGSANGLQTINNSNISNTLVGTANITIVLLLLFCKDKVRAVEIDKEFSIVNNFKVENTKIDNPTKTIKDDFSTEEKESEKYLEIFQKCSVIVEEQFYFKDADFTISDLSNLIRINNLYIAKSIKLNGYSSFSHYINFSRVQHVKKLIDENDLNRITLMYIYTSSGFTSQSTFNRVFKHIEGITPTEYISNLQKKTN
jgi:AraC-like DNA-binding protein